MMLIFPLPFIHNVPIITVSQLYVSNHSRTHKAGADKIEAEIRLESVISPTLHSPALFSSITSVIDKWLLACPDANS